MSKLEELVPPLELCKLIPKGEFEDCAFLWEAVVDMNTGETVNTHNVPRLLRVGSNPFVYHEIAKEFHLYPAPTLEEIMAKLPPYAKNEQILACCVPDWADFNARIFGEHWRVGYTGDVSVNDKSPSTASLKLWLELKGIAYEKA
jgi:hypothetical protein